MRCMAYKPHCRPMLTDFIALSIGVLVARDQAARSSPISELSSTFRALQEDGANLTPGIGGRSRSLMTAMFSSATAA